METKPTSARELSDRIKELELREGYWSSHVSFEGLDKDNKSRIYKTLDKTTEDEKLELTTRIYQLLVSNNDPEIQVFLGTDAPVYHGRTMGTIANQGRQFRIWHTSPGFIRSHHADSGGEGLLLHVDAPAQTVDRYVNAIFDDRNYQTAQLPNGVKLIVRGNNSR